LTIAHCQPTGTTVNGSVELLSVTYLEDTCRCTNDITCTTEGRVECRPTNKDGLRVCAGSSCL
jgi:hypothetical protein